MFEIISITLETEIKIISPSMSIYFHNFFFLKHWKKET